jgi:hypothetical protein
MRLDPHLRSLVQTIHAAPLRFVYSFAGAGSLALAWLHAVPGSSRSVLAAFDAYAPAALQLAAGQTAVRDGAVTASVATALARRAYRCARRCSADDQQLLGIGLTAALRTDRVRRGSDRAYLVFDDGRQPSGFALQLQQRGRTRLQQEISVARLLINELARRSDPMLPLLPLAPGDQLRELPAAEA